MFFECPSCGAPIDGSKCPYCWTLIRPHETKTFEPKVEPTPGFEVFYADNAPIMWVARNNDEATTAPSTRRGKLRSFITRLRRHL